MGEARRRLRKDSKRFAFQTGKMIRLIDDT